ncbi:polysaccharide deacetylase family protein [Aestuariibaculum suncheonense]|uniref:Polysaccharide deacetylase family protein n=1 Tax=Aestuariibaculum suncheonense TaxID=1028745 RepID=A0A8J6QAI6_9FLAO|nr:polysaccharide deacetylase family protein [Aestuariibaculum suncheonense]MBD0836644.1 polysaccharide deacetylase family protein [Aestuariibaculum suncheonense]
MPTSFVKIPVVIKKMFPNYVWDITTTDKVIYLTFDDGPTPEITNWTLQTLRKHNAKATFFCIGNNIEKHPEIFQNILKEGHTIGNHTHNHLRGWKTSLQDYLENIKQAQTTIEEHKLEGIPLTINLFRPPYGKLKPKQGKQLLSLGYKIIMWDIISFDWDKDIPEDVCLENVISKTKSGSIVVFHDSLKAAKNMQYALPKVLKHFTEKGYRFEAIPY